MSNKNLLALIALTLSVAACGVDQPDDVIMVKHATPESFTHSANEVSGTFEQNGVEIRFSITRRGDSHSMHIEGADGLSILDAKAENGLVVTTVFSDSSFSFQPGRADAFARDQLAELASTPEMQMLPALRKALDAAGVDNELLDGPKTTTTTVPSPALGTIECPTVRTESSFGWAWSQDSLAAN